MAPPVLTRGAVKRIHDGEALKPRLQIRDIKSVPGNHGRAPLRYKVALSDGVHLVDGIWPLMLNTQIRSQKVKEGVMIHLLEFTSTRARGRRQVSIAKFEVIGSAELVGTPTYYEPKRAAASPAPSPTPPTTDDNQAQDAAGEEGAAAAQGSTPRNDAAAAQATSAAGGGEAAKKPLTRRCVVCWERRATAAFVHGDCAHLAACIECARSCNTRYRQCPVCRRPIERVVKIFTSS